MWSRFNGVAGNLRSNITQFAADVQQQLRDESDGDSPDASAAVSMRSIHEQAAASDSRALIPSTTHRKPSPGRSPGWQCQTSLLQPLPP